MAYFNTFTLIFNHFVMMKYTLAYISILTLIIGSCGSMKYTNSNKLYTGTWELDYISGPGIAFQELFPDKKPQIGFNEATGVVSGNSSCNGYTALYTLDGNSISFGEPGPTTMMYCGEGEKQFLNTMQKVNAYNIDAEGKLNLIMDDVPLLRFKKID
jgi:heat shock protein HslJ